MLERVSWIRARLGKALWRRLRSLLLKLRGLSFTAKVKKDLMILLQTRMEQKSITLPMDRILLSQINAQQYRFGKVKPTESPEEKGIMTFYHPSGTHDDQLWALAKFQIIFLHCHVPPTNLFFADFMFLSLT